MAPFYRKWDAGVFQDGGGDSLPVVLAFSAILVLVQAAQMPLYFKLGYARAKFMSVVPFAAFMAGYCAFLSLARDSDVISGMSASLARLLGDGSLTAVMAAAALALAVFVSCRLSLAAYRKREF